MRWISSGPKQKHCFWLSSNVCCMMFSSSFSTLYVQVLRSTKPSDYFILLAIRGNRVLILPVACNYCPYLAIIRFTFEWLGAIWRIWRACASEIYTCRLQWLNHIESIVTSNKAHWKCSLCHKNKRVIFTTETPQSTSNRKYVFLT